MDVVTTYKMTEDVPSEPTHDHELLVPGLKARHPQAWDRFYMHWYPQVYTYAFRRIGDHHGAADVASEVFLSMLREIDRYDPQKISLAAWIFRLAHHRTVDYLRRQYQKQRPPNSSILRPTDDDFSEATANRMSLQMALRALTEEQQAVLLLRFFVGLPLVEVAKALNKSPEAVRGLQFRALCRLRQLLSPEGGDRLARGE